MSLGGRPLALSPAAEPPALAALLEGVDYREALAALHARRGPARYLEIGVAEGHTLRLARGRAIGIDPAPAITQPIWEGKAALHLFAETADAFFAARDPAALLGGPLDLAFIDGMHHAEYALRDLLHCERHMAPGGAILLHDILPWHVDATRRLARRGEGYEPVVGGWTGDVWKVLALVEAERPDLRLTLLDCAPTGLAILAPPDPSSTRLGACYDALEHRILGDLAGPAAFRDWLACQSVTDSRAWIAAGCPIGGEAP